MSDDYRRDNWQRESEGRVSRRPGGERDFYGRDQRGEDDYGLGYGEEGMTNYRLLRQPRPARYADDYGPYGRSDSSWDRGAARSQRQRDLGSDFSSNNEFGARQMYGSDHFGNRYGRRDLHGPGEYARQRGSDGSRHEDRGFWDRASDEVSSWFGDEDAENRRRMDARHQGRGPKGYRRSDERIREDVSDRLTDDPFIDASDIEIAVSNSEVTLSGTVDSRTARRRAEDLTERCSGISHVQNNLRVASGADTVREEPEKATKKSGLFSGS